MEAGQKSEKDRDWDMV